MCIIRSTCSYRAHYGAIREAKPRNANLRAAAQANLIRPRYAIVLVSQPDVVKPVTGEEQTDVGPPEHSGWLRVARRERSAEEPGKPGCGRLAETRRLPAGIHNRRW